MLLYCNERRISIPTENSIIESIHIIDSKFELEPFESRRQIVVDSSGRKIPDLTQSPSQLGLSPDSTIYIINPLE
jgi:hypothetical protein